MTFPAGTPGFSGVPAADAGRREMRILPNLLSKSGRRAVTLLGVASSFLLCGPGCSRPGPGPDPVPTFEDEFGIHVESVRVAAAGSLLDVRYTVVDPVRASAFQQKADHPRLVSERTGLALSVPVTAKAGSLRQTPQVAEAGRVYFILFRNIGSSVKTGDRVDLQLGDRRSGGYVVL